MSTEGKCRALTKKGVQCTKDISYKNGFCGQHCKCQARTRKGDKCKKLASDTGFCTHHKEEVTSPLPTKIRVVKQ